MKKAIGLALAVLMTSVVAASAQGAHKVAVSAASSQSINCKQHDDASVPHAADRWRRLPRHRAGELGEVRRQDAAPKYGLKVKLALGDTPVEQGPAPAQALAQKYIADKSVVAILGPSTSGDVAAVERSRSSQAGLAQSRRRRRTPT